MSKSRFNTENDDATAAKMISFVIRVWREENTSEQSRTSWRGHITPVLNGERRYFTDISEISTLLATYLEVQD